MFLSLKAWAAPQRGGALILAAAAFAAGLTTGAMLMRGAASRAIDIPAAAHAAQLAPLRSAHPADVLRILDGDTFEARVRVWPGMDITTRVRLRGIDAPEMHARCDRERRGALAARDELTRILAEGGVGISRIGQDKYGGRVDADVSTAKTADVSAAMLQGGFARAYSGGHRQSWCN